jgi:hypothetical protein
VVEVVQNEAATGGAAADLAARVEALRTVELVVSVVCELQVGLP